MKRSRIICSIVTIIYIILSVALTLILVKSSVSTESSVSVHFKAIHIAVFGICTLMYVFMKNKLAKKMSNKSLSVTITRVYHYIYLAVIALVSRFIMAYVLKDTVSVVNLSFSNGVFSYLNYGLGLYIGNQMYANVIINTILAFGASVLIKKLMLNITDNDTIATTTSIMYLLLPQSLVFVTEYVKYSYNVIAILLGLLVFTKIIEEVQNFNKKNNKYLIYSVVFGLIQSVEIILGGSYVMWVAMLVFTTFAAMYIDSLHIRMRFNSSINYKVKRFAEKIERINISKLVCVSLIALAISGVTTLLYGSFATANNYQMFSVQNSINVLVHSRSYYIVLIIAALVFEIIGVILKRKLDVKMFGIKVAFIAAGILTFFMVDTIYASAVLDMLLVLTSVLNICNICYNREEKVKLLKDKN